jgi:quercetin dioxygenase-like cupin family protein
MKTSEIEKLKIHKLTDLISYVTSSAVSKTLLCKTTGYINIVAIDTGETLAEKISPFDTFIYVIEGAAELLVEDNSNTISAGQTIIIPAHSSTVFFANQRFKMISAVIKSGYEGITF